VRAPIDGRTGVRLIDAGNLVTANQPGGLVVLTQTRPVAVVFALPQQALPALRRPPAQPGDGPLAVEVLSDQGHPLARGRLDLIDNQIDPASGTLRLKATFANWKKNPDAAFEALASAKVARATHVRMLHVSFDCRQLPPRRKRVDHALKRH
jgi:multidrug efflux pump subunit AcrA (membrane-fusion protein)